MMSGSFVIGPSANLAAVRETDLDAIGLRLDALGQRVGMEAERVSAIADRIYGQQPSSPQVASDPNVPLGSIDSLRRQLSALDDATTRLAEQVSRLASL